MVREFPLSASVEGTVEMFIDGAARCFLLNMVIQAEVCEQGAALQLVPLIQQAIILRYRSPSPTPSLRWLRGRILVNLNPKRTLAKLKAFVPPPPRPTPKPAPLLPTVVRDPIPPLRIANPVPFNRTSPIARSPVT